MKSNDKEDVDNKFKVYQSVIQKLQIGTKLIHCKQDKQTMSITPRHIAATSLNENKEEASTPKMSVVKSKS